MWSARNNFFTAALGKLVDSFWNYTSLLVKDIGINGATNNSFFDDGPYNFLPTRNGDVTQGTFSPFGPLSGDADPTAVGGSVYFDGSGDYLTVPANTAFAYGSGDFTIEFWYQVNSFGNYILFNQGGSAESNAFAIQDSYGGTLYFYAGGGGSNYIAASVSSVLGAWRHIAVVRYGTVTTLYADGKPVVSGTSLTYGAGNNSPRIGAASNGLAGLSGNISNLRIVKGTAVYTAEFTPPAAPLTAISGTSLLTCQSATSITDASSNAFTVTRVGDARANPVTPFGYGSAYFDGTGDYLTVPTSDQFTLGTGDFTIEAWVYPFNSSSFGIICDFRPQSSNGVYPTFYIQSGGLRYLTSSADRITGGTIASNTWQHVAVSRSSGSTRMFVNGVQVGSDYADTNNYLGGTSRPVIGNDGYGQTAGFNGYISNFRVVKGTGVYTSAFTPSTAPLTAITGTSLLTCQDKGRIVDTSSNGFAVTRAGDVKPTGETPFAQKGSGQWSAYFDGVGDYLTLTDNSTFNFGTSDFTVEMFFYANVNGGMLYDSRPTTTNGAQPILFFSGNNLAYQSSTGNVAGTTAIPARTWHHVALTRSGTTVRIFVDGVLHATRTDAASLTNGTNRPMIGADGAGNGGYGNFNGYISNLRVIKGTALYTSAFTPPVAPLDAVNGTGLLTCQDNRFKDNSSNNFTVTKAGDVSVSRFNPFGSPGVVPVTNLASTGSIYFRTGNADYMTYANNTAFDLPGDFTIEFWINPTSGMSDNAGIVGHRVTGGFTNYSDWVIRAQTSAGKIGFGNQISGGYYDMGPLVYGAWSHYAVTRSGSTVRTFCNGALISTNTDSGSYSSSGASLLIGENAGNALYYKGYISNLRIVKGTAVYTSAFTPPTSPLTAVSGTSLLIGQDAVSMSDVSGNNFTATLNAAPAASEASPFKRVTFPYGGSYYGSGTNGQYLTFPPGSMAKPGSGDFTLEAWIYRVGANASMTLCGDYSGNATTFSALFNGNKMSWARAGGYTLTGATDIPFNAWTHVAFVRQSNTLKLYVNGNQDASASDSANYSDISYTMYLGQDAQLISGRNWNGYISNFRVVRGSAVYTANFTPPTSPVAAVGGTSLLLNFDNAGVYDGSGTKNLVSVGDAKTSTSTVKYAPGASTYFDGTGDWLTAAPDDASLRPGTGSFTWEFWWYPTSLTGYRTVLGKGYNSAGDLVLQTGNGDGKIVLWASGSAVISSSIAVTANTWNHVAVVRNGTGLAIYINGTSAGTATNSTNFNSSSVFQIGDSYNGASSSYSTVGYIQDVRVTNGVARYTSNFSVPTASFPTSST